MPRPDHPAPRRHGAVIDRDHPEFFEIGHRYLPDTADLGGQPERHQVVDDYLELVRGVDASAAEGSQRGAAPGVDEPDPGWSG